MIAEQAFSAKSEFPIGLQTAGVIVMDMQHNPVKLQLPETVSDNQSSSFRAVPFSPVLRFADENAIGGSTIFSINAVQTNGTNEGTGFTDLRLLG